MVSVTGAVALLGRARGDLLLRNSLYLMGCTMVSSALGYIYWTLAARLYTPAAVGGSAALVSAMSLAALIGGIGGSQAIVAELPRRSKPQGWAANVTAFLLITTLTSLVTGLGTAIILALLGHNQALYGTGFAIAALTIGSVVTTVSLLLESIWIAERQAGWSLVYISLFSIGKLLLLPLPIVLAAGALGIFGSWIIALAVIVVAVLVTLHRMYGYRPAWSGLSTEISAVKASLTGNYFVSLGDMAPVYLIPLLVSVQLSTVDTAYFYAAWKIGSFFPVFASSVGSSVMAEGAHAPQKAVRIAVRGMRMTLPFIILGTLLAIFLGRPVLGIFGPGYADHAFGLLILLAISAFPDTLVNIYRSVLRVQRRYATANSIVWGITASRIVLTWILLPHMGIVGAGWAWLITQCLGAGAVIVDLLLHREGPAVPAVSSQEQIAGNLDTYGLDG